MKNRQRHGYKQHWSAEYRKLMNWRKINAILKEHLLPRLIEDIFVERPITTMLLKRR